MAQRAAEASEGGSAAWAAVTVRTCQASLKARGVQGARGMTWEINSGYSLLSKASAGAAEPSLFPVVTTRFMRHIRARCWGAA